LCGAHHSQFLPDQQLRIGWPAAPREKKTWAKSRFFNTVRRLKGDKPEPAPPQPNGSASYPIEKSQEE
jgi:hypothetical protein